MGIKFIQKIIDLMRKKQCDDAPKYIAGINTEIMPSAFVDNNCEIGDYTYIGSNCNLTKATIGRYTSIGNNVTIGPGEHKLDKISTSAFFAQKDNYEELTEKDCIIGNDVWIGVDSIIRRGVKVGDGAIIGANSFVNKDVPDFSIVAGSPAKFIRYRFDESTIEKIKTSKWWEHDLDESKEIVQNLQRELR